MIVHNESYPAISNIVAVTNGQTPKRMKGADSKDDMKPEQKSREKINRLLVDAR